MNMDSDYNNDEKTEYVGYGDEKTEFIQDYKTELLFGENGGSGTYLLNPGQSLNNGGTNDTFSEELHRKKKVLKYMDHVLGDNPVMKYKPGKKH